MGLREENAVPLAALLLSLSLHAALLAVKPGFLAPLPVPTVETIVVDLLTEEKSETPLAVSLPAQPPAPPPSAAAPAKPSNSAKRVASPPAPLPSDVPKLEISKTPPLPDDMELSEATSYLPDPSGSGVAEATLRMTDADARYRGFLDAVREAVYRKWNSRDALLAAKKSGTVTLRFTLVAGGGGSSEVSLLKSSGTPRLDEEALRAVKTARLPPFPDHWTLQRLHLVGDFQYAFAGAGR